MSGTTLQLRGGTGAENDAFTGSNREATFDTSNKALRLHDGVTPGGSRTLMVREASALGVPIWAGTVTGTANALVATPNPALLALVEGAAVGFLTGAAANTGACNLTVSGAATRPLVRWDGVALKAGDLPAGAMVQARYAGSAWRVVRVAAPGLDDTPVVLFSQAVTTVTQLAIPISADFTDFELRYSDVLVASNGGSLTMRTGTGGTGGAFDSGASDYFNLACLTTNGSPTPAANSALAAYMGIGTGIGVANGVRAHGTCRLDPGSTNRFPSMQNRGIGLDGSGTGVMVERYGSRQALGRINALLIQPLAAANFSGTFTLCGRRA